MDNNNQLLQFYVDRVLKKHNVSSEQVDISDEEKQRMKEIIENIQADVQSFLDNANKSVTESNSKNNSGSTLNEEKVNEEPNNNGELERVEQPLTKPKIFVNKNKK